MAIASDALRDYQIAEDMVAQQTAYDPAYDPLLQTSGEFSYDASGTYVTERQIFESLRQGVPADTAVAVTEPQQSWWAWLTGGKTAQDFGAAVVGSNPITEVAMSVYGHGPASSTERGYQLMDTMGSVGGSISDRVRSGADAVTSGLGSVGSGLATAGKWATLAIVGLATLAVVVAVKRA
jgi:hypothetical protein